MLNVTRDACCVRRIVYCSLLTVYCLLFTETAVAHGGETAVSSSPTFTHVLLLTGLTMTGWLYWRRTTAVWQQLGQGRGIAQWQLASFLAAIVVLAIALASPLETWSGQLFSAHMVQHVLLILVAAPLLALSLSPAALAWLAPHAWRRPTAKWLHRLPIIGMPTQALLVWLLYAVALWLWHIPALYEAALASKFVHVLEHGSFLGTAVLFWWLLAYRQNGRRTSLGLLFVFTTALHSGFLGVLLTFSRQNWYTAYAATPYAWGITPLTDQQLGGAIMWVVAGFIYLFAILALLHNWLQQAERREQWVA